MMRVTVSTPPPAGTLTTILIGLLGKSAAGSCAHALETKTNADEIKAKMMRMCSSVTLAGSFMKAGHKSFGADRNPG